jgi:peroxiredoxin
MPKVARSLPELFLPLIRYDYSEDLYEITQPINISREFKKNSLVLGIPGAFFPSVQYKHLAEYKRYYNEVRALVKVDKVLVLSNNDPFVLKCFAEEIDAEDKFVYVSDFNSQCIKILGTSLELPWFGLRSAPFRCIVRDGVIHNWIADVDWKPTSRTRVFKLLREASPYAPYPNSVYSD